MITGGVWSSPLGRQSQTPRSGLTSVAAPPGRTAKLPDAGGKLKATAPPIGAPESSVEDVQPIAAS